jgi:2-keto-4-pentenoate hydratase/2-oxohepta-3-ene-1,7-dioic acid hydratase in catechol pathway
VRFGRFEVAGQPRWGVIDGELVTLLAVRPWEGRARLGGAIPLAGATFLPPCEPTKIVCIGLNYKAHAEEQGKTLPEEPLLFLKAPSALLAHGGTVVLPDDSRLVEHEAELAFVIGRRTRHVRAAQALDHVLGYTCLDDVSARDIQRREKVYTRAKGFDTFCPVGPWLETEIGDPQALEIELRVNGDRRQRGTTGDMIFSVAEVIAFISRVMTLEPGDLVTTGTPPGVGPLVGGDTVEISIEGIGVLRHSVGSAVREA